MFSQTIRRIHMYVALFLAPWILMYAASTAVMNHRETFRKVWGEPAPFVKERATRLESALSPDLQPKDAARQILAVLEMEGAHGVQKRPDGTLVIQRQSTTEPRRITYSPATGELMIERRAYQPHTWLETMHRRRGFQHPYWLEDAWAAMVDGVIVAIAFWAGSGLWMWWELKKTRRLGAIFLAVGVALFAFFLVSI